MAIVFHEWSHARVALWFGDDTAYREGRLTFNPTVHADPIGTLVFPLLGAAMGGIMFGWARPVPVDPRRFRNFKSGVFWVSFAGPLANVLLSIVSAFLYVAVFKYMPQDSEYFRLAHDMTRNAIFMNLVLAVFNLIPFPPLDGSKMVSAFLDYNQQRKYEELQRFSFVFLILLWVTPLFSFLMVPARIFASLWIRAFEMMLF